MALRHCLRPLLLALLWIAAACSPPQRTTDPGPGDAGQHPKTCGGLAQECCLGPACDTGLVCRNALCAPSEVSDLGHACTKASDCTSGLCQALRDGRSVCTASCGSATDCAPGWSCDPSTQVTANLCGCVPAAERCDGLDNDCDGVVDNGAGPAEQCAAEGNGLSCVEGTCACASQCGGRCVNLDVDNANCGGCGHRCPTGSTCQSGACACPDSLTACGSSCIDTSSSAAHCGDCSSVCPTGGACAQGECFCPPGEADCDGVCVDQSTDEANCGACGHACEPGAVCSAGQCACPSGRLDCGGRCVIRDVNHCGACDAVCPVGGLCTAAGCACPSGQIVCGGACVPSNAQHCGTCDNACATGASCSNGSCQCPNEGSVCHGACKELATDVNNCGSCDHACLASQLCSEGECVCPSGKVLCDGQCIPVSSDPNNCGSCHHACQSPQTVCQSGQCTCPSGQSFCNGSCTSYTADPDNCGGCGQACPARDHATRTCSARGCGYTCVGSYEDCNGSSSDGCEADLTSDDANCGLCAIGCAVTHGESHCSAGLCGVTSCEPSYDVCGTDQCVDFDNDRLNCGTCGFRCGAGVACVAGDCQCGSGLTSCPGICANVKQDTHNCGTCGNECSPSSSVTGTCQFARCSATLFTGSYPTQIVAGHDFIYLGLPNYTNSTWSIRRIPIAGGPSELVASSTSTASLGGIALNSSAFYYAANNSVDIVRIPLSGGAATTIGHGSRIAVNDHVIVYYTLDGIMRMPAAGGTAVTLVPDASTEQIGSITLDDAYVYWTAAGTTSAVARASLGGGTPTTMATLQSNPSNLSVDATGLTWVAETSGGTPSIVRLPIGGGDPITIAYGLRNNPVSDGTSMYWFDGLYIRKAPVQGGASVTIAQPVTWEAPLALDANALYFGISSGANGLGRVQPR